MHELARPRLDYPRIPFHELLRQSVERMPGSFRPGRTDRSRLAVE